MVVDFGPQGMAEQRAPRRRHARNDRAAAGLPLDARLAAPSRLGFRLPQNTGFILFSDEGLLDWAQLQPNLPANANPPNGSKAPAKEPTALQTSIVYPWRLHLAPAGQSFRWNHSAAPVEHDGRTELWHTRFTSKPPLAETRNPGGLLRAVWSEDYDAKPGSVTKEYKPFRMSLNPNNRTQIVSLSSDFGLDSNPKAILARNLMLSPQGAWADLRGDFLPDGNKGFNVEQWSTRGTMGREHFAKVIERGYLLPLGHKAVLITITERKIQTIEKGRNAGRPAAVLRQRQFIVVREPQRSYDDPDIPLKRVRITTEVTPNLNQFDEPQGKLYDELTRVPEGYMDNQPAGLLGADGFWPRVGDDDFLFDLIATDVEGVEAAFKAPLMFVTLEGLKKGTPLGVYGKTTTRRARPLLGQELAYAPPLGSRPRSTAFKTETFTFGVKSKKEAPFFRPFLDRAAVEVPSLKQAAGNAPGAGMAMVRPAKLYVDAADKSQKDDPFDAVHNRAQAFLETVKDANFDTALDYGKSVAGDLVGGLGQPNLDLGGLSRTLGPLGGEIDKYADLVSDKLLFFDKYLKDAKFLGVSFADVLEFAGFPLPDLDPKAFAKQLKKMPSTLASTVYDEAQAYAQDAAGEAQKALDEASGEGQKAVDEAEKAIADAEKQLGEAKDAVGQTVKDIQEKIPKELRFDFNWEPKLKDSTFFLASGGGKTAYMKLRALTVVPLNIPTDPTKPLPDSPADLVGTPTYEVVGRLENFTLLLFGDNPFLTVEFNRVVFEASQAKKPSVDVDIRDVRFGGALEFVNELRELLTLARQRTLHRLDRQWRRGRLRAGDSERLHGRLLPDQHVAGCRRGDPVRRHRQGHRVVQVLLARTALPADVQRLRRRRLRRDRGHARAGHRARDLAGVRCRGGHRPRRRLRQGLDHGGLHPEVGGRRSVAHGLFATLRIALDSRPDHRLPGVQPQPHLHREDQRADRYGHAHRGDRCRAVLGNQGSHLREALQPPGRGVQSQCARVAAGGDQPTAGARLAGVRR